MKGSDSASAVNISRNGHARTNRTALTDAISKQLLADHLVFIEASFGYGKSMLLDELAYTWHRVISPSSPIVRVSFSSRKFELFQRSYASRRLAGIAPSRAQSASWLDAMRTFGSVSRRTRASSFQSDSNDLDSSCYRQHGSSVFSALEDEPHVRWIWACVCDCAPAWVEAAARGEFLGQAPDSSSSPIVLVDDLKLRGTKEMRARFSRALRVWQSSGLRVIIASTPGDGLHDTQFSDLSCFTNRDLTISTPEFGLWRRDLCLGIDDELFGVTHGVPALVSACRYLSKGEDISCNDSIAKVVTSLFAACSDEPGPAGLQRLKGILPVLGTGSIDDLMFVDDSITDEDLDMCQRRYPLYGLNVGLGTFDCPPLTLVEGNEAFSTLSNVMSGELARCGALLFHSGRYERAHALMGLLDDANAVCVYADDPLSCADAASLQGVRRAQLLLGDGRRMRALGERIAAARGDADAEGASQRYVSDALVGLVGAHDHLGRGDKARRTPRETSVVSLIDAIWASWREIGVPSQTMTGDADDERERALCRRLVAAAARGDAETHAEAARELLASVDERTTAGRLATHHVAITAILCGHVEGLSEAIVPLVRGAGDGGDRGGRIPACATTTLLLADAVFARLALSEPAERGSAEPLLRYLRELRVSLEMRGLVLPMAQTSLLEGLALLLCGFDLRALEPLGHAVALLGSQGSDFGQMVALLGKACCEMTGEERETAQLSISAASRVASRLGIERWEDAARLLGMVAEGLPPSRRASVAQLECDAEGLGTAGSGPSEFALLSFALRGVASDRGDDARRAFGRIEAAGPLATAVCATVLRSTPPNLRLARAHLTPGLRAAACGRAGETGASGFPALGGAVDATSERPLCIRLLRDTCVELNGHRIDDKRWGRKMSKALLVCLSLAPGQAVSRERMARLLWPTGRFECTRQNLSVVLSSLRKMLGQIDGGPEYIVADKETISLNLGLVCLDVVEFEHAARSALSIDETADDLAILEAGERIDLSYGCGIERRWADFNALCGARARELDELFCDCMARVSGLALDMGRPSEALRLARHAQRACADRPDIQLLVIQACEALRATGDVRELLFEGGDGRYAHYRQREAGRACAD